MILPPAILDMRVPRSDGSPLHLWLPVFLLWPLLWLIWLLALLAAALLDLGLLISGRAYHRYTLLLWQCYLVLCHTRGLALRVKSPETDIDMTFA